RSSAIAASPHPGGRSCCPSRRRFDAPSQGKPSERDTWGRALAPVPLPFQACGRTTMLVKVEKVLNAEEIEHVRGVLAAAEWMDGKVTAGAQSALAKNNLQVPEDSPQARALGELILRALGRRPVFNAAALPLRVFPPLFNRYDEGMRFGAHVDNA